MSRPADGGRCADGGRTLGQREVVAGSGWRGGRAATQRPSGRGDHARCPADGRAQRRCPTSGPVPVLVVDQCEEAVTLCDDPTAQSMFFAALAARAEHGPLVVALRADRLGELSAHPDFARLVEPGLHLLSAMGDADLRAAIEGPARQVGLLLEPGLVDLLVREVEGEPGALPLLSHALHETWQRREGRTLTVDGYQATGGIRGAVAQSAEEVYNRVPAEPAAAAARPAAAPGRPLPPRANQCAAASPAAPSPPTPSTTSSSSCSSTPGW